MNHSNTLFVVLVALILSACSTSTPPTAPITVITATSYPELPNIEPLAPVNLIPWRHDAPRDLDEMSVISSVECRKVKTKLNERKPYVIEPVEPQTTKWWADCGEHPILPISNIHVGFDLENWNIILEDFFKLKERTWQYEQRLKEINNQRQKWRDRAYAERNKQQLKVSPEENPIKEKPFLQKLFGN